MRVFIFDGTVEELRNSGLLNVINQPANADSMAQVISRSLSTSASAKPGSSHRRWRKSTAEDRSLMRRLAKDGLSYEEIGAKLGFSSSTVWSVVTGRPKHKPKTDNTKTEETKA